MPRRAKRQTKNHEIHAKKQPATTNGAGVWQSKPGANLSLILSRVRAAQVRRLHFR